MGDKQLSIHSDFRDVVLTIELIVTSIAWLMRSVDDAARYFSHWPFAAQLDVSVLPDKSVKIGKNVLDTVREEREKGDSLSSSIVLRDVLCLLTIALKEAVWKSPEFQPFRRRDELEFLRHLRNAAAHGNRFNIRSSKSLPLKWRNKVISPQLNGKRLYFDFMAPGDLFILMEDISRLVKR